MHASLFKSGENTSGFNNDVSTSGTPLDFSWVSFLVDSDGLAVDDEFTILGFDGSLKNVSIAK